MVLPLKALEEALRLAVDAAPGYIIALRIAYVDYSANQASCEFCHRRTPAVHLIKNPFRHLHPFNLE
jgi:hypothetical protein